MMSSCHREDQGERPPGVRNALFFPVVFRKAVINLIPSSSLCAPGVQARGGRGGRRQEEEGGDAGNSKRMGHSHALPKRADGTTKAGDKGWSELLVSFI